MDLNAIAEQTGGTAYYNTNGFKDVIAEIVSNGSNYYTLAYATSNQKWEGQFRHGKVAFVTLVFDQEGHQVNSLMTSVDLNVSAASYRQLLAGGLPMRQEIAVPVKGNYFLRVGAHDLGSDHIGAMEIPVDAVHADGAGGNLVKQ